MRNVLFWQERGVTTAILMTLARWSDKKSRPAHRRWWAAWTDAVGHLPWRRHRWPAATTTTTRRQPCRWPPPVFTVRYVFFSIHFPVSCDVSPSPPPPPPPPPFPLATTPRFDSYFYYFSVWLLLPLLLFLLLLVMDRVLVRLIERLRCAKGSPSGSFDIFSISSIFSIFSIFNIFNIFNISNIFYPLNMNGS